MKLVSFVFAALFALGAIVQWNDPDPAPWILAYCIAALLSLCAAMGRTFFFPSAIASAVFIVWFITIAASLLGAPQEAFTSFRMQAESHEQPREAAGLALLASWCFILAIRARPKREKSHTTER